MQDTSQSGRNGSSITLSRAAGDSSVLSLVTWPSLWGHKKLAEHKINERPREDRSKWIYTSFGWANGWLVASWRIQIAAHRESTAHFLCPKKHKVEDFFHLFRPLLMTKYKASNVPWFTQLTCRANWLWNFLKEKNQRKLWLRQKSGREKIGQIPADDYWP